MSLMQIMDVATAQQSILRRALWDEWQVPDALLARGADLVRTIYAEVAQQARVGSEAVRKDAEVRVKYLQRMLGYSITGLRSTHAYFVWRGAGDANGGNGKGTGIPRETISAATTGFTTHCRWRKVCRMLLGRLRDTILITNLNYGRGFITGLGRASIIQCSFFRFFSVVTPIGTFGPQNAFRFSQND